MTIWLPLAALVSLCTLVLTISQMRRFSDPATQFLIFVIWFRYVLSAFHEYTTMPLIGGVSFSALMTMGVVAVFLALTDKKLLALKVLAPLYAYIALVVLSGVINREIGGMINGLIKWFYLLTVAVAVYAAVKRYGPNAILRGILPGMITPLVLGLLSYAVGYGTFSEFDQSMSYRGGYIHEAVFSVIIFTLLSASILVKWKSPLAAPLFILIATVVILLANYRTTILAMIPIIITIAYSSYFTAFHPRYRGGALILGVTVFALLAGVAINNVPDRFQDLVFLARFDEIDISEPRLLTDVERSLMSGRIFIWSLYLSAYLDGDAIVRLIGYGVDAWMKRPQLFAHAHNNFIHELYSLGLLGLGGLFVLLGYNLYLAYRIRDAFYRLRLIAIQLGIITINLATSPLNIVEGVLLYGVIFGFVWGMTPQAAESAAVRNRIDREGGLRAWAARTDPGAPGDSESQTRPQ